MVGNIVESMYSNLKAIKGHSFPNETYIEFQGDAAINPDDIQNVINAAIAKDDITKMFEIDAISFETKFYKLPYRVPENKKLRVLQIGDMLPVPCGGTHLPSIKEIGHLGVGKVKAKNNSSRISYKVT